jgi:hypothetical protein
MRWLRVPPVAGAVLLLGLLGAGPAAAQPDHLHLDLALVSCGTLQATAFELPPETRIDVRFVNADNGATLHQASPTTDADGALVIKAKVELAGVDTVRMTVARAGEGKAFAFSEMTIPGECPLPFTGPSRWPALTALALGLLAAGSVLLGLTAYRGRHRAAAR